MSTSLLCEKAFRFTNAKTYVFSHSMLCVEKKGDDSLATWKSKIEWYSENNHFKDMNRIDGMPTEFERKIFPGIIALGLLEKIQNLLTNLQCEPEHVKGRIIFMSIFNDIVWDVKGSKEPCEYNSQTVAKYARKFPRGHWSFLGLGSEEKCYGICTQKPDGSWNRMAQEMMANFSRSSHPIFRASSAFARGELRSKGRGKKSIHFNGSHETIELLLRTVISANQLSISGAITDLCDDVSKNVRAPGKSAAPKHLEEVEIPTVLSPRQKILPKNSSGEPYGKNTSENSSNCQKTRSYPNCVLMQV